MMGELKIPGLPKGVVVPEEITLLQWTAIIHAADYFIGCDSVGQHIAHAIEKPGTVVIGSTFPENTSYTSGSTLEIIDNGIGKKMYSPIRMTYDIRIEKNNEYLMKLTDKTINKIVNNVKDKLGAKKVTS